MNIVNKLTNIFDIVDSYINAKFILDGREYEIEHFSINFTQEIDHKGQPQNETKGGQFSLMLSQSVSDTVYDWAKRAKKRKDGKVLFQSQTRGTILEIAFSNADCISLKRTVNAMTGLETTLVIAPEKISLNGITHNNQWREE